MCPCERERARTRAYAYVRACVSACASFVCVCARAGGYSEARTLCRQYSRIFSPIYSQAVWWTSDFFGNESGNLITYVR